MSRYEKTLQTSQQRRARPHRCSPWQRRPIREIARCLGRCHTSILREIRCNQKRSRRTMYLSHRAQQRAEDRHHEAHRHKRLKSFSLQYDIEQMLAKKWSPEIIAGILKRQNKSYACAESIYQWIYKAAPHLIGTLPRSHPKRRQRRFKRARRVRIPHRIPIHQRPAAILARQQLGHWETDQMVGPGVVALQVLIERVSRFVRLKKVQNRTAPVSKDSLVYMLKDFPANLRQSITYDNGSENMDHLILNRQLNLQSYFCEPYHSWEKGSVENVNGLIRWFFPKRTDFSTISDDEIRRVEYWLNHRPRKILQFQTPADVLKTPGWCINT